MTHMFHYMKLISMNTWTCFECKRMWLRCHPKEKKKTRQRPPPFQSYNSILFTFIFFYFIFFPLCYAFHISTLRVSVDSCVCVLFYIANVYFVHACIFLTPTFGGCISYPLRKYKSAFIFDTSLKMEHTFSRAKRRQRWYMWKCFRIYVRIKMKPMCVRWNPLKCDSESNK